MVLGLIYLLEDMIVAYHIGAIQRVLQDSGVDFISKTNQNNWREQRNKEKQEFEI